MDAIACRDQRVETIPPESWELPRRRFVKQLFGGAAAAIAAPALVATAAEALDSVESVIPDLARGAAADEAFWRAVRDLYPLRPGLALVNAANLCPSSYPVMETEFRYIRDVNVDTSFQNRGKFSQLREEARSRLAAFVGADPEEIAIVNNTTAGNNQVITGLELRRGDEIVIWSQNHPTNNIAWDVTAQRYGLVTKRVDTPAAPADREDLTRPFREALTGRTRVLALTHLSNVSGVALPIRELCAMARERGILTLVDGVQTFGALKLDLHEMGCDFFTASSHKWLTGPRQAGILYIRRDRIGDLWPAIVGVGYGPSVEDTARKFETLGQRNDATIAAITPAVDLHVRIGLERVEARVRELAAATMKGLREKVPGVRLRTPSDPDLSGGVVIFHLPDRDHGEMMSALYAEFDVACARMSGDFDGIRFSPHIYNTMDQIDQAVDAVARLATA
jgi:selenocysteine lyase/cysteine desulfurase